MENHSRKVALVLAALLSASPACAEDHLEPELSPMQSASPDIYDDAQVHSQLKDAFAPDVKLRMLALPQDDAEYVIGLRLTGDKYFVFRLDDVSRDGRRCETEIRAPLGRRIVRVWKGVLLHTRYEPDRGMRADGEWDIFAMEQAHMLRPMSGMTWMPPADSEPGLLLRIARGMSDFCTTKDPKFVGSIDRLADELERKLAADH